MAKKDLKPFAFLGYDKSGEAIIKDLTGVAPGNVPGNPAPAQDDPPPPETNPSKPKQVHSELIGFSRNSTWVYINGRWYKIG